MARYHAGDLCMYDGVPFTVTSVLCSCSDFPGEHYHYACSDENAVTAWEGWTGCATLSFTFGVYSALSHSAVIISKGPGS